MTESVKQATLPMASGAIVKVFELSKVQVLAVIEVAGGQHHIVEAIPDCCFLTDSGLVALELEKGMSLPTLRAIQDEMPLAGCTVCACMKPTDVGDQQGGRA